MDNLPVYAVVVAGGKGSRLDPTRPKQYLPLAGKPILIHTLERLYNSGLFKSVIVVLPETDLATWADFSSLHKLDNYFFKAVKGGASRFYSVEAGLNALEIILNPDSKDAIVAIHDGVRPFINNDFLLNCLKQAKIHGNAIPSLPAIESFRILDDIGSKSIDRTRLKSIQTPQCAYFSDLYKAWKLANKRVDKSIFTDEASVLEFAGHDIHLCEGLVHNLKITQPSDLLMAEFLMEKGF